MARIYGNPNLVPSIILYSRLSNIDPSVGCGTYDNVSIISGSYTSTSHYAYVDSLNLSDSDINNQLSYAPTATELGNLSGTYAAKTNFLNLPNWASWSADDVDNNITNAIFTGWNQTQVNSYIDSTATNLAGAITVMKQLASAILTVRGILVAMGKAIVFLRQLVVQFTK